MRRVMSYEFEDPEDLTYGTTGDIGEYVRLEMVTLEGAKLPVLPSYYMLRKEEGDIVLRTVAATSYREMARLGSET